MKLNKKGPTDQIGPQQVTLTRDIIKPFFPLHKRRVEALLMMLQDSPNPDGLALDSDLARKLFRYGWDSRAINTAANDLARSGRATLEHTNVTGTFRLVLGPTSTRSEGHEK